MPVLLVINNISHLRELGNPKKSTKVISCANAKKNRNKILL